MKPSEYKSHERDLVLAQKEELLKQLNSHVRYLRQANRKLQQIDADVKKMSEYYFSEWLDDYNHFNLPDKHYDILSQDHIHGALQDIYIEKIKLLKKIVNKIGND